MRATHCISPWRPRELHVLGMVDVDAVAALILGDVAGRVRGAQGPRHALGLRRDRNEPDADPPR